MFVIAICHGCDVMVGRARQEAGEGQRGQLPLQLWRNLTLALRRCMERNELKINLLPHTHPTHTQLEHISRARGARRSIGRAWNVICNVILNFGVALIANATLSSFGA